MFGDASSIRYKCVCWTRADGADIRGWPLIVVERDEVQLYLYLREDYGPSAEIIFDRRYPGDRRRVQQQRDPIQERRHRDRRIYDISHTLSARGWTIVHPDTGTVAKS
jgi:hypothetical protein